MLGEQALELGADVAGAGRAIDTNTKRDTGVLVDTLRIRIAAPSRVRPLMKSHDQT